MNGVLDRLCDVINGELNERGLPQPLNVLVYAKSQEQAHPRLAGVTLVLGF